MIKYGITFSTNHNSVEKPEQEVKNLIIELLECAGIDGATLIKNAAGIWQGETEDSYTLYILSDLDITTKIHGLALNLKVSLKQESVMIEQCTTDTEFL